MNQQEPFSEYMRLNPLSESIPQRATPRSSSQTPTRTETSEGSAAQSRVSISQLHQQPGRIRCRTLHPKRCNNTIWFKYDKVITDNILHMIHANFTFSSSTEKVTVLTIPKTLQQYVRGLICCWSSDICNNKVAIYNPTTRQTFYLPEPNPIGSKWFFGYDPIENRYKVLYLPLYHMEQGCQVFTLGEDTQWRTIQGFRFHYPMESVVCINGAIYYLAKFAQDRTTYEYKVMIFDVRSEKFIHVEVPKALKDTHSSVVNYQGKLGYVCCEKAMEIWVMDDDEKQGWSRIFFYDKMDGFREWHILGATTRGGEIVFVDWEYLANDMLWILYYDPKRNSVRYVDLKGTYPEERRPYVSTKIWSALDHVDNTMSLFQSSY